MLLFNGSEKDVGLKKTESCLLFLRSCSRREDELREEGRDLGRPVSRRDGDDRHKIPVIFSCLIEDKHYITWR